MPKLSQASSFKFPKGDTIVLLGEPSFLSEHLRERLEVEGYRVNQVVSSTFKQPVERNVIQGDFSSEDTLEPLRTILSGPGERVGGVINVMGLSLADTVMENRFDESKTIFLLLKLLEQDIRESAKHGGGIIVNVTGLDGAFGLEHPNAMYMGAAGTIGVCKSVAREWASVRVKCIDLELLQDPQILSSQVWNELCTWDGHEEIGLSDTGRGLVELLETPIVKGNLNTLPLDSRSVILLLGGGYGITAEVGKALAKQYKAHLVIVGRSVCPDEESLNTVGLNNSQDLRQYFIKNSLNSQQSTTPAEIEKHITRVLRQREIRSNLSTMRKAGSKVTYHSLDIRDSVALGKLVDSLYSENSSIQGVIHAAGIIDDKLIQKKTAQSFDAVMDTKIIPAMVLAKHLRPEGLHFLLFFSSISARFGNAGQTDYSAANEILNKMAGMLCGSWPQVKVASLNWGPWAGGMVDEALQHSFEKKGIGIIAMDEGVQYCLDEVHRCSNDGHEILISAPVTAKALSG